jgi:osmotically-inducible protein OsmY
MKRIRVEKALPLLAAILLAGPVAAHEARPDEASLEAKVEAAILTSPRYGVFDLIRFEVKGDTVTLGGVVTRPTLKSEAATAVAAVPGVARVVNGIEILPLSIEDDRLRRAVFEKIYRDSMLSRYGTPVTRHTFRGFRRLGSSAFEPLGNYAIHIVVKGGHVTLYGLVDNASDRDKAVFEARSVFGVKAVASLIDVRESAPEG